MKKTQKNIRKNISTNDLLYGFQRINTTTHTHGHQKAYTILHQQKKNLPIDQPKKEICSLDGERVLQN